MKRITRASRLLWCAALLGAAWPGLAQAAAAADATVPAAAASLEQALVAAIAAAEPSVVAIARVEKPADDDAINFEVRPSPFGIRTLPALPASPMDPDFLPDDFAAGVVVGPGAILTAYHVLAENSEYYVTTRQRKVYRAWVKGADPRSDLAVLAVDATNLPPIRLGHGSELKKGQMVVALGNPFAIARDGQSSASWGIVANLNRKAPAAPDDADPSGKTTLHHFGTLIQTDAKLNLGTSGGPLVDLTGAMVGLTTSLPAAAGYDEAAGYAFPVDETFRRVVDTLKEGREVEYGFLGIQPLNLSAGEVLSGLQGTRVHRTVPGTPAYKYGVETDDIVTTVNGKPIYDADGLILEVGKLPVESRVKLGVVRGTQRLELEVVLTKYPVRGNKVITQREPAWRGLRVDYTSAVTDAALRAMLDTRSGEGGVVVTEVEEKSAAAEAGIEPGDVVVRVDGKPINTPREFREAVAAKSGPIALRRWDDNRGRPVDLVLR